MLQVPLPVPQWSCPKRARTGWFVQVLSKLGPIWHEAKILSKMSFRTRSDDAWNSLFASTVDMSSQHVRHYRVSPDGPRMSNNSLPSVSELDKLPNWAIVAYASRCARRSMNHYSAERGIFAEPDYGSLSTAIDVAEEAAGFEYEPLRGDVRSGYGDIVMEAVAIRDRLKNEQDSNPPVTLVGILETRYFSAEAIVAAAYTYADAGPDPGWIPPTKYERKSPAVSAWEASEAALKSFSFRGKTDGQASKAMRFDFELLSRASKSENWTDETPVPSGFFGPLWPFGVPKEFYDEASGSEGKDIIITFDVPDGMDDAEVLRMLEEVILRADSVHRAYGGHGLTVDEGNLEIHRGVTLPVPTG